MDLATVRSIESAAYNSWPARERIDFDGWQLRFADGFSRRGNSVYPAANSTLALSDKLDWCRRWYVDRGLNLVVRQNPATEEGLDAYLEDRGFSFEGKTNVMTGPATGRNSEIAVCDQPSSTWWHTTADLWGFDLSNPDGWVGIVNRIDRPAGFVSVAGEAAGLAVADGAWLGLFEIVVRGDKRRTGLGSAVTRSLLGWGRSQGATSAYLQVVADNVPAIRLYESLGFEPYYSYWYRRDQEPSANKPA